MNPDIGLDNFLKIKAEFESANFNESDTRVKIIDRILRECLGWEESDFFRETNTRAGYVDYELKIDGITRLVIEAKRSGDYFEIAGASEGITRYKISGVISKSENLLSAIDQCHSYCVEQGCKYSVVTNGKQFIVFASILVGKKWREGSAIVFHSFGEIEKKYNYFHDLLSYKNVKSNSLGKNFEKFNNGKIYRVPLDTIHNADERWLRNQLYTFIKPLSEKIFSELLDETQIDILKDCYVVVRADEDVRTDLEGIFVDKKPHFGQTFPLKSIKETELGAGQFEKNVLSFIDKKNVTRLVVLLGGVGSGKSTFIHRFFKIVLKSYPEIFTIFTDFRQAPPDKSEISKFIFRSIAESLGTYFPVAEELLNETSIKAGIEKLKNSKKVILIIDNVDQHSRDYQEQLFLISNALKKTFGIVILVSLREETFYNSSRDGVLDAYTVEKYHIASPNLLSMIRKRLEYSIAIIENKQENKIIGDQYNLEVRGKLLTYFKVILASLRKENEQSRLIVKMLDNISYGNMRKALEMFYEFLISGNTDVMKILSITSWQGTYQISLHQMIKSIMLGERRFFDYEKSTILNLFDFDVGEHDSLFINLRVLRYLDGKSHVSSRLQQRGFVEISEIIQEASSVYIDSGVLKKILSRLVRYDLVEFDNLSKKDLASAQYAKITFAGKYYLHQLIRQPAYLAQCVASTPISDESLYKKVFDRINETDVSLGFAKTVAFLRYLKNEFEEELLSFPELGQNTFSAFDFESHIYKYAEENLRYAIRLVENKNLLNPSDFEYYKVQDFLEQPVGHEKHN